MTKNKNIGMGKSKVNSKIIFLIIAFIEGAAVMAVELFGAKMIAPFFGTTIYSWAGVLAITLLALASGYYIGGILTTKFRSEKLLFYILLVAGLFMILMPFTSTIIMKTTMNLNILAGLLISLFVFLLPPVLLFGMVSPVIIYILVSSVDISGKTAGKVYAVSTIGGVLNTLLLGFYIIPEFGIRMPSFIYGAIIFLLPMVTIFPKKFPSNFKFPFILFVFVFTALFIFRQSSAGAGKKSDVFRIIYSSEGLLGQVKVIDFGINMKGYGQLEPRGLLVNNTWQTVIVKKDQVSLLDYVYFINPIIGKYPVGSDVLLIGLGGGTLTKEIQKKKMKLDVVEIDRRLKKIAVKYFNLDPATHIIIDDGRHYLRTTEKKYDIIIFDAFLGENPPWQLLTLESFEEANNSLKPGGVLVIEFYGYIEGKIGQVGRSVYKTLSEAGFHVNMITTRLEDIQERNLVFIASKGNFDFENLEYDQNIYSKQTITDLKSFHFDIKKVDMNDACLLTDDRPVLEKLVRIPTLEWRKSLNKIFRDKFIEEKQPIYY